GHSIAFDQLSRQLERQKCRVTFVEMEDRRIDTQSLQQAHSADTQHHLLDQTGFLIAAVKMTSYQSIDLVVFRNVRVQKVKLHAADISAPHARGNRAATHDHLDQERPSL